MYGIPVNLKALSLSTGSSAGLNLSTISFPPSRLAMLSPICFAFGQCVVPRLCTNASCFFFSRPEWLPRLACNTRTLPSDLASTRCLDCSEVSEDPRQSDRQALHRPFPTRNHDQQATLTRFGEAIPFLRPCRNPLFMGHLPMELLRQIVASFTRDKSTVVWATRLTIDEALQTTRAMFLGILVLVGPGLVWCKIRAIVEADIDSV
jgi:hypothetical protein